MMKHILPDRANLSIFGKRYFSWCAGWYKKRKRQMIFPFKRKQIFGLMLFCKSTDSV